MEGEIERERVVGEREIKKEGEREREREREREKERERKKERENERKRDREWWGREIRRNEKHFNLRPLEL